MGVRISAYAVDLPGFDEILDWTLGQLLLFYCQNAPEDHRSFFWCDFEWPDRDIRYHAIAQRRIVRAAGREPAQTMTEAQIAAEPFLQRTARTHLVTESSITLKMFLEGSSVCREIECVQRITRGHRRWWIGSLLQTAREFFGPEDRRYVGLENVLVRTLREYNCGLDLPETKYTLADVRFPIVPAEDCDDWMSVWTPAEIRHVVGCFEELLASKVRFTSPPRGLSMDDDSEWDPWVREMMGRFMVLSARNLETVCLVTFIDS